MPRTSGLSPKDFVGKTDYDFFPAEFARKYRDDDQRVMITGLAEVAEEVNRLDNHPRIVEVTKTPVVNDQQEVIGILGLYVDITERKKVESALRESERKYRTLFERIADPIFIFDRETTRLLDCNQSFAKVYGYTIEELHLMTPLDLEPNNKPQASTIDLPFVSTDQTAVSTHVSKSGVMMAVEILTRRSNMKAVQPALASRVTSPSAVAWRWSAR
ncbi:MAG: PAS domain S-box protein [Pyrinomonadaceae bacterium]